MLSSHSFDPSILRAYDIRGLVDKTLHPQDALAIGLSFGTILKRQNLSTVTLGYDGRASSPVFRDQLTQGLLAVGINVIDLGICPSPLTYFSTHHLTADASIMITGSHNPAAYNGFKFTVQNKPFFGNGITHMGAMATTGDWDITDEIGTLTHNDIKPAYIDRLIADLKHQPKLKIVWDGGNGVAGSVLKELTEKIDGEHILIFDDIDGTFPNHHPDPTVEKNLQDLIKTVTENDYDIGFAFDGDADRIGVVDKTGRILWPDEMMAIYAADILSRNPGAPIIGDVKCSKMLFDEIERLGGEPVIWKTGHSTIKSKMNELNAPLAGELSGHVFFKDGFYGYDDALYCAVRLLDIIGRTGKSLTQLSAHLPQFSNTPEMRLAVDEDKKLPTIQAFKEYFTSLDGYTVNMVDGIRIDNDKGWLLIRPSNTESVLSARAEAINDNELNVFKKILKDRLIASGLKAPAELD